MKNIVTAFILLITPFLSDAQITRKLRKVVPLLPQQSVDLAGARSGSDAVSRASVRVDLPPNTIEWYYLFTVGGGQTTNDPMPGLAAQLEKNLDPTGAAGIDVSSIRVSAGSHPCAVYLMNKANADLFMQKVDNTGGSFLFFSSGTRENAKEGVVQIKDAIYGSYWLGFKDPGAENITVRLEAAAITEEIILNNREWSEESKQNLFNTFYDNIKGKLMDEADAKDIASCMIQQLNAATTPGDYYAMNQPGKDSLLAALYSSCASKYEEPRGPEYLRASNYGNLGWKEYEKGNIDSSIRYNEMSLALDSSLAMVRANLGLLYLIKDKINMGLYQYANAMELIRKLKLTYRKKEYLAAVIKNLDDAMKKYPGLRGAAEMKELFEEELKKY